MPGFNGFLDLPARPPKPRTKGLTHVIDKGLTCARSRASSTRPATTSTSSSSAGARAYVTRNLEKKIALYRSFETPVVCGGTLFEAVVARGKLDEYRRWLEENRLLARRDLGRDDRPPTRAQARAHRRALPGLRRHVGGRLQGLRGRLRPLPVGAVAEGRSRGRRLEGDHRGPRGRDRRDLPLLRRHAHRPDRRDRPRARPRGHRSSRRRRRARRRGSSRSTGPTSISGTSRPRK